MISNFLKLQQAKQSQFKLESSSEKMDLSKVFNERNGFYLNELTLFMAHFNTIPNLINEVYVDCKKASDWFCQNYQSDVKEFYFNKRYYKRDNKIDFDDLFFILYDDLIVNFDINHSVVRCLFKQTPIEKVEKVIEGLKKFKFKKNQKNNPQILLLVNAFTGIHTRPFNILKPKLSIDDNYNDDFKEVHKTILNRLSKKNDKGLVLLHGKPGTGKTSYIRYLISLVKKDVIFLPPNMASAITNPDLINILIDNPNSIFVIEDAENIIVEREVDGASPVSALLNISDGLLADCLNVQVICSFNTDISKIDNALLRKGRLIAKYEFKELTVDKAQSLSDKLGFKTTINKPMNLTSIYNQDEKEYSENKKKEMIGFRLTNN
ncbi:MAG: AAA family ATPase [Bacteroidia bacterium]